MTDLALHRVRDLRVAAAQAVALGALVLLAFAPELAAMSRLAVRSVESAHGVAALVLLAIMFAFRRRQFADRLGRGSTWGIVLIVVTFAAYTMASWPFNFAYPRWLAIVPALAGVVLAVGGWRALRLAAPLLVVLAIAVPMGMRHYARLMIEPETRTLDAVAAILDTLPGVFVDLEGPDMTYDRGGVSGTIALGEQHRGASLFLAFLLVGVYTTFVRVRPLWQIAVMAVLALPVLLLSNFARVLTWGLVTIYGHVHPLSAVPRTVATVASLVFAYAACLALLAILDRIVTEPEPAPASRTPGGST